MDIEKDIEETKDHIRLQKLCIKDIEMDIYLAEKRIEALEQWRKNENR